MTLLEIRVLFEHMIHPPKGMSGVEVFLAYLYEIDSPIKSSANASDQRDSGQLPAGRDVVQQGAFIGKRSPLRRF